MQATDTADVAEIQGELAEQASGEAGGDAGEAACEEWRPVFGGDYEISSRGRFRRATPGRRTHAGRELTRTLLKIGYYIVQPVINGKNQKHYIHALVAEAFLGPRPENYDINHKDGIKTNNDVSNLEYVTHAENMRHANRTGLIRYRSVLPESTIEQIRSLRSDGLSYSRIAKATGVSIGWCWQVTNGGKRNAK